MSILVRTHGEMNVLILLTSRSGEPEGDDDDNVELDKSNVLLMGPTGSGTISNFYFDILF